MTSNTNIMFPEDNYDTTVPQKILWSCVARNDVILAEAGTDVYDGSVTSTARELLKRKPTPGFEFHTQSRQRGLSHRLKGVKFHLFEHGPESTNNDTQPVLSVWVFAAVYDPSLIDKLPVQSFLEKLVGITEFQRETAEWREGTTLACQASFAPILLQRMQEVTYYGKMAMIQSELDSSKALMQQNIERLLERGEKLDNLNERSTKLKQMAGVFKKQSKRIRRMKMLQNAKYGAMMGTAITVGVAIVVIPPLVAIL